MSLHGVIRVLTSGGNCLRRTAAQPAPPPPLIDARVDSILLLQHNGGDATSFETELERRQDQIERCGSYRHSLALGARFRVTVRLQISAGHTRQVEVIQALGDPPAEFTECLTRTMDLWRYDEALTGEFEVSWTIAALPPE